MIKGLECLRKADRIGTILPGEENTQGHLISVCKSLKRRSKEDGAGLFSEVLSARTAGWH